MKRLQTALLAMVAVCGAAHASDDDWSSTTTPAAPSAARTSSTKPKSTSHAKMAQQDQSAKASTPAAKAIAKPSSASSATSKSKTANAATHPAVAHSAGMPQPAEPHLEYAVLRDGDPVGRHVVNISRQGDATDVDIKTNVAVTMAFITVYRFEHAGREHWVGKQLVSLKTKTNDNGTYHDLAVSTQGDHLAIGVDGKRLTAPAQIIPASLWYSGMLTQTSLLNTLDGRQMAVSIRDDGMEAVKAHGHRTDAHHYSLTGGLDRELWFDANNTLVRVAFAADDGSHIVYELQ